MKEDVIFGRQEFLSTLKKRVSDLKDGYRQNIAIVGDEMSGKTSIVYKFLSAYCDSRIVTLYIEARPESLLSFGKRFIGVLLYNFLANSGISLQEDLDFLLDKAGPFIPKTTQKIKEVVEILEKRRKEAVLTELFSLCDLLYQETGKFCIVILDEFHNLENVGIKRLYAEWSKLLITQRSTMYILVSSARFKTNSILSKELSLLFGNFEVLEVGPFDIKESESYLDSVLDNKQAGSGIKDFIVHFTGGIPFYLKTIARMLPNDADGKLVDVMEEILFSSSGILNQRFANCLKRYQESALGKDYLSVLYLVACGHSRIKDIAHMMRKTRKELDSRVSYLLSVDAVSRNADFLQINDRVFSFWLKFVYQSRINSLTFDAKNQKQAFRNSIEYTIKEFLDNSQRPVIDRIREVMHLFGNEMMLVERKKIRLSHFLEIKPLEFGSRGFREGLICRSPESLWILALKRDVLTESDISDFSAECKKYRYKLQRKIIVAFQDLDLNSRLRALDEKISTWNLQQVNQIFDLFSKPRIIA